MFVPPKNSAWWPKLAAVAWISALVGSSAALAAAMGRPGEQAEAPSSLSQVLLEGRAIAVRSDTPTLIITAHPLCPCTRATLSSIETYAPSLAITIVSAGPTAGDPEAEHALRSWAARHNAGFVSDRDGSLARTLGAYTSGYAALYDAAGVLRFSGGLTPARGHAGRCDGLAELERVITEPIDGTPAGPTSHRPIRAPVFGCRIFDDFPDLGGCAGCVTADLDQAPIHRTPLHALQAPKQAPERATP